MILNWVESISVRPLERRPDIEGQAACVWDCGWGERNKGGYGSARPAPVGGLALPSSGGGPGGNAPNLAGAAERGGGGDGKDGCGWHARRRGCGFGGGNIIVPSGRAQIGKFRPNLVHVGPCYVASVGAIPASTKPPAILTPELDRHSPKLIRDAQYGEISTKFGPSLANTGWSPENLFASLARSWTMTSRQWL